MLGVPVVPYIGTWIETAMRALEAELTVVVPYIGTWIETLIAHRYNVVIVSYLI